MKVPEDKASTEAGKADIKRPNLLILSLEPHLQIYLKPVYSWAF
jgi:hypothetical protein